MKPLKIFIVDDHELVREGLSAFIRSMEGLELIGTAANGEDLIHELETASRLPDICLLDIEMPGKGGVATLKMIKEKFPEVKVLIVSMHSERYYINRVIREGADGYLMKNLSRDSFMQSIDKAMKGEPFFVEGSDLPTISSPGDSAIATLTVREKHILKLIAHGKSNKEIANELFISNRTVDTHRTNLMRKLNISSSVQLVHFAYSNNLI